MQVHDVKNQKFNKGNVKYELLVQENTTVETHGIYKLNLPSEAVQEVSIIEAYEAIDKVISKFYFVVKFVMYSFNIVHIY